MASKPHPMAKAFEKAVADKMNTRKGSKQSTPSTFPKLGHKNAAAGGADGGKAPAPFKLHPKNKKKVSAKRGTTR